MQLHADTNIFTLKNIKQKLAATTIAQRLCIVEGVLLSAIAIGSSIWFLTTRKKPQPQQSASNPVTNSQQIFYHATGEENYLKNVVFITLIYPKSSNAKKNTLYVAKKYTESDFTGYTSYLEHDNLSDDQIDQIGQASLAGTPIVVFWHTSKRTIWDYSALLDLDPFSDKTATKILKAARKAAGWNQESNLNT